MFEIPEYEICLVGIDPGTRYLGYSRMMIDSGNRILSVDSETIVAERSVWYDRQMSMVCGDSVARIYSYRSELLQRFTRDRPTLIACESPFFHRLHPGSYGPLVETFAMIREVVWQYDSHLVLAGVPPMVVKKSIGARSNATKEEMTEALIQYPLLKGVLSKGYIAELDEHSVDAIAVVNALYRSRVLRDLS